MLSSVQNAVKFLLKLIFLMINTHYIDSFSCSKLITLINYQGNRTIDLLND